MAAMVRSPTTKARISRPGLVDVFLHVIDVVIVISQRLPVLQDGFGAIAIMYSRQQPSPGTGNGFEHSRVLDIFNGLPWRCLGVKARRV